MTGKRVLRPGMADRVRRSAVTGVTVVALLAAAGFVLTRGAGDDAAIDPTSEGAATQVVPTPEPTTPTATESPSEATTTNPAPRISPRTKHENRKRNRAETTRGTLVRLAERLADQADDEDVVEVVPTTFRAASFNVLGDSHTAARGNKPGYASGTSRMAGAVRALRAQNIDVVALQEFEQVQKGAFLRATAGRWSYHVADSRARDALAWREDTWAYVDGGFRNIPYFHGNPAPMPWALLQHRVTGQQMYFISVHNPTSNPRRGNNDRHRVTATRIQIALANEMQATGIPVVLMGDFNERDQAYCMVTAGAAMTSANGGFGGPPCQPPSKIGIDHIFGTAGIVWSGYSRDDSVRARGITDHPLVVATGTYTPPTPLPETMTGSDG